MDRRFLSVYLVKHVILFAAVQSREERPSADEVAKVFQILRQQQEQVLAYFRVASESESL